MTRLSDSSARVGDMTTLGVVFLPYLPPERLRSVARAADDAGLDELWLWEDCFREGGISTAAAALAWTERVRVGIGLLPVALRSVAITAMELSSLERMFPGRVLPGVGHGVQEWMGQVGARVASPMTLLREYTDALRRLLAGETVTTSGRYVQLDDVTLSWPTSMPVLAGALGPKSLRLCGEIADGLIIAGGTAADARMAFVEARAGRAASGRTDAFPVTMYLMAATGPDAQERLDREILAWEVPDPADAVAVAGDAETIATAVREWADAGADSIVLQPTRDDPDLEGFIRFVAEEVRPLV